MSDVTVRIARADDAPQLLEVYAPYVRDTAISFEYEVPTPDEFRGRIVRTLEKYPYIVAERNGRIVGYAYAGVFKERPAYDWSVEVTIYVATDARRSGVGRRLYTVLEGLLRRMNVLNANACIAYPQDEGDELTKNSSQFHAHLGYRTVGTFHNSGYKLGRWYDMLWMEKMLGGHTAAPSPVLPFPELCKSATDILERC